MHRKNFFLKYEHLERLCCKFLVQRCTGGAEREGCGRGDGGCRLSQGNGGGRVSERKG